MRTNWLHRLVAAVMLGVSVPTLVVPVSLWHHHADEPPTVPAAAGCAASACGGCADSAPAPETPPSERGDAHQQCGLCIVATLVVATPPADPADAAIRVEFVANEFAPQRPANLSVDTPTARGPPATLA